MDKFKIYQPKRAQDSWAKAIDAARRITDGFSIDFLTGCSTQEVGWLDCQAPDPSKAYTNAKVENWDPKNPKNSSLFVCEDSEHIKHVTCDENFNIVEDVTSCPDNFICKDGECVGELNKPQKDGYICIDSDPENNPYMGGRTEFLDSQGSDLLSFYDRCLDASSLLQYSCKDKYLDHNPTADDYIETTELCEDDRTCCVSACVPTPFSLPVTCEDSDPDDNLFIKGFAVLKDANGDVINSYYDRCDIVTNQLRQVKCSFEITEDKCEAYLGIFSPFTKCPEGTICVDGACATEKSSNCSDSENGANVYVGGDVTLIINDKTKVFSDRCLDDGSYLLEYSCDGNQAKVTGYSCFSGCNEADGACNLPSKGEAKCVDNDTTNDSAILGSVILLDGTAQTDFCSSDYPPKVTQVDCSPDGSKFIYNETACGDGEICDGGACHKPNSN